jgi:dihydropteroate synthase
MGTLASSLERALVMGILNVTPDSFSDGGDYVDGAAAARRAEQMIGEGADIIDVGAESTRPGAAPIGAATQIARLGGTIEHLTRRGVVCSIDTTSPEVAAHALGQGAKIVNLVDPSRTREMAVLATRHGAELVVMHARGAMRDMAGFSAWPEDGYRDVVAEVARELEAAARVAASEGLAPGAIALDPGFGFSKNARQSLALAACIDALVALGHPVVVGASRKSFLARISTAEGAPLPPPAERVAAGLVVAVWCVERGAAVVRTHDVAATRQALATSRALASARAAGPRRDAEVARA